MFLVKSKNSPPKNCFFKISSNLRETISCVFTLFVAIGNILFYSRNNAKKIFLLLLFNICYSQKMLNFNPSSLQVLISAKFKEIKELKFRIRKFDFFFFLNFTHVKLNSCRYFLFGTNISFPLFSVPYKSPEM